MMAIYKPKYIRAFNEGKISNAKDELYGALECCNLCPRECGVNRLEKEIGVCKTGINAVVSSVTPHFGEESPLVGSYGSGTIFFTHCNLLCSFCQNFDISHQGEGYEVSNEQLAGMMLKLQQIGCHNINFVTPSHVVPQIVAALEIAVERGLSVPLVYNSGGYDKVETLRILEGIIDIYMPDLKFFDLEFAALTCDAPDYPEIVQKAIIEMFRQTGDLVIDDNGIAQKGLLIRHLVMPGMLEDTKKILQFISTKVSKNTYVNVMPQYRPCGNAYDTDGIARKLTSEEFDMAVTLAINTGLTRIDG